MATWTPDSQQRVQPLTDSTGMCGIRSNQNQGIPSYRSYYPPLWLWNVDNLSTVSKESKPLSHDLSEKDSWHHMIKTHARHRSFNSGFSSYHPYYLDAITASLGRPCVHMKHHRLPNKLLYGELSQSKRSQVGQKKRFKDTLKVSMKSFGIAPNCPEYLA